MKTAIYVLKLCSKQIENLMHQMDKRYIRTELSNNDKKDISMHLYNISIYSRNINKSIHNAK